MCSISLFCVWLDGWVDRNIIPMSLAFGLGRWVGRMRPTLYIKAMCVVFLLAVACDWGVSRVLLLSGLPATCSLPRPAACCCSGDVVAVVCYNTFVDEGGLAVCGLSVNRNSTPIFPAVLNLVKIQSKVCHKRPHRESTAQTVPKLRNTSGRSSNLMAYTGLPETRPLTAPLLRPDAVMPSACPFLALANTIRYERVSTLIKSSPFISYRPNLYRPLPPPPSSSSSFPSSPPAAPPARPAATATTAGSAAAALRLARAPRPLLRSGGPGGSLPLARGSLGRRLVAAAAFAVASAEAVAVVTAGNVGGGVLPEGVLSRVPSELLVVLFVRELLVAELLVSVVRGDDRAAAGHTWRGM